MESNKGFFRGSCVACGVWNGRAPLLSSYIQCLRGKERLGFEL